MNFRNWRGFGLRLWLRWGMRFGVSWEGCLGRIVAVRLTVENAGVDWCLILGAILSGNSL